MLKEDTKETRGSAYAWATIEDINQRAEAAVQRHPEVFEDPGHQARVAAVEAVCKAYFAGYTAIYCTARATTRSRSAHTEVKVARYVLRQVRDSARFKQDLHAAGAGEIVWKHNTESVSVHVW
jgi:predicted transcriptional regulator